MKVSKNPRRRRELQIAQNDLAFAVQIVVADLGGEIQVESSFGDPGIVLFDEIRLERHQVHRFERNVR